MCPNLALSIKLVQTLNDVSFMQNNTSFIENISKFDELSYVFKFFHKLQGDGGVDPQSPTLDQYTSSVEEQ